ncbi:MAG: hypothetical protein NXI04_29795 [Planctomycetaceae bacterium]|nr:hypothetical protein [Planctomycetaceae bacterium]
MAQSYTEYTEELSAVCNTLNGVQMQTFCLWCSHRLLESARTSDPAATELLHVSNFLRQLTSIYEGHEPASLLAELKSNYTHRYLVEDTLEGQDFSISLEEAIYAVGNTIDSLETPHPIQAIECGKNVINALDAFFDNAGQPVEVDTMFDHTSFRLEWEFQRGLIQTLLQSAPIRSIDQLEMPKLPFGV